MQWPDSDSRTTACEIICLHVQLYIPVFLDTSEVNYGNTLITISFPKFGRLYAYET
jgi:hypothetical protein